MRQSILVAGCALSVSAAFASMSAAQCSPEWLAGAGYAAGFNGTISAITEWDPDGAGPLDPWLVVGGSFRAIGSTPFIQIAAWNGTTWHRLGNGPGFASLALTVYHGELIAGGALNPQGGAMSAVARWDGSTWRPLGDGVDAQVNALYVHDDELFAGGEFTRAGDLSVHSIASWDGARWKDVGGGVSGVAVPTVFAIGSFGDDLIAGGFFQTAGGAPSNNIARWDGKQWSPLAEGRDNGCRAVLEYQGELVAGGHAFGSGGEVSSHIARWDGTTWRPLGSGLNRTARALTIYRGDLIAGGDFNTAGGQSISAIARWDGSDWLPLESGIGLSYAPPIVMTLGMHAGKIAAGGLFETAGGSPSVFFARWRDGADFNTDGAVDSQDFFDFLSAFFANDPRADFNADGFVDSQDFFDFIGAFFGSC